MRATILLCAVLLGTATVLAQQRTAPAPPAAPSASASPTAAADQAPATSQTAGSPAPSPSASAAPAGDPNFSIKITSPQGRTGVVTKVRIVAQIQALSDPGAVHTWFFVDGKPAGEADAPPYAVDWVDENPFERREIVVQAQDAAGRTATDTVVLPAFEITDQSEVTSVLLEAGVYDKRGRFVSKLDPGSFTVRENGVPQATDSVARETVPTTIVLLVDNSQSMSRRMDFVRLAAERLADTLRQRDKIIVVPFNKQLGAVTGPTNDPKTIAGAVTAMTAAGGTAIADCLLESTALFKGAEGRRALVLLTDGYDENSIGDLATVIRDAQNEQIAIHVVGIGGVAGISLKGERMLRQVAEQTGGRVYFPLRELDMADISDAVSTDIFARYVISYTPNNKAKDGTWREISVEVPGGYQVRTRTGYFAPSPAPIRPTLEFTVMNSSHEYLDVASADLEVVEDGVVQKVDTFQEAVEPVSMVMAIDESGSMVKASEGVKQAAREFVTAVRPEDQLAVIMFSDRPLFAHGLGTTRKFSLDAIDAYKAIGGTSLYDALYNSLLTLKDVPGRRAVVVMTDGRDENNAGTGPGSEHNLDEVLGTLRTVNAAIFAIGLGARVDHAVLERLAKDSGGAAYFPEDVSALEHEYRNVIENLRRRYVVSYTSSNKSHDGRWRKVEIRSHIEGLQITARGGYYPPTE